MQKQEFVIHPVGFVKAEKGNYSIELIDEQDPLWRALTDSATSSYLVCHMTDKKAYRCILTFEKPYAKGHKAVGVFATWSPFRPNPFALTVVKVLEINHERGIISSID